MVVEWYGPLDQLQDFRNYRIQATLFFPPWMEMKQPKPWEKVVKGKMFGELMAKVRA